MPMVWTSSTLSLYIYMRPQKLKGGIGGVCQSQWIEFAELIRLSYFNPQNCVGRSRCRAITATHSTVNRKANRGVAVVVRYCKRPTHEIILDNVFLVELNQRNKPSAFYLLAKVANIVCFLQFVVVFSSSLCLVFHFEDRLSSWSISIYWCWENWVHAFARNQFWISVLYCVPCSIFIRFCESVHFVVTKMSCD